MATTTKDTTKEKDAQPKPPLGQRIWHEMVSWFWVILAFLFIHSSIVQARVIPSASMEDTLLIGDHLLVSRFGYDAEIPFTSIHWTLWRDLKRQQVVVFRRPGQPDFVKRVIGLPGDTVEIHSGAVWVNGRILDESYLVAPHSTDERSGPHHVPAGHYFVMGDNRYNSLDSRYWGFVAREDVIGTPLILYMSIDAQDPDAWQPGHLDERFRAYLTALVSWQRIRWSRLFLVF